MNTTIESVRDEVAKKSCYPNGEFFYDWNEVKTYCSTMNKDDFFEALCGEVAELYHTRKCEEAGRELPSENEMKERMDKHGKNVYQNTSDAQAEYSARHAYRSSWEWMKEKVSALLASLKSQLEVKDAEIVKLKEEIERLEVETHTEDNHP